MGRLAGVFVPWFLGQCWLVDVGSLYPLQRPIWTGKDMSADLDLRLAAISDFAEKTSEVDPGNLTKVKPNLAMDQSSADLPVGHADVP